MSGYPLQSVLDLRRREEIAAATGLADATRARTEAERREAELTTDVEQTRERARRASEDLQGPTGREDDNVVGSAGNLGAAAAAEALFVERRRDQAKRAAAALLAFRRGPLAEARARESTARESHLAARRVRAAFEKHAEKHNAVARAGAQRRDEEALEDIARAIRHVRRRETER